MLMLPMLNSPEKPAGRAAVALCLKRSIKDVVVFGKFLVYQFNDFTSAVFCIFFHIYMRAHGMDV